ncbi:MAG: hypothetical protein JXJ22_05655 [Bacteroidales bacterium]|nr:hypothetical protein [Bacteroidales bacterium]
MIQDLHIHTIFSSGDSAVVQEQTVEFIASLKHAKIVGISDHFEYIADKNYEIYKNTVKSSGFKTGTEVDGHKWADAAAKLEFDYYIYHCWDVPQDYKRIYTLLDTGKPVIIAHPYAIGTRLEKIPRECLLEINNRYIFKADWKNYLTPYLKDFDFILSSDAHQPHWLNQNIARFVADQLNITEKILFPEMLK